MDADEPRPALAEDEYRHILSLCGINSIHLRAVSHLFLRLWVEAATWDGRSVVWQDHSAGSVEFLGRFVIPSLGRAAALDTHALALKVSGRPRKQASTLSQRRFEALPALNSGMAFERDWCKPPGGLEGVSSNVVIDGTVVRRKYVGFTATPPSEIDFSDAPALWKSACMWRLVGEELHSNVPAVESPGLSLVGSSTAGTFELKPGLSLDASFNQDAGRLAIQDRWSTGDLQEGDELRVSAQCSGRDGEMFISATLNGHRVVRPTLMVRCSFAMELWPYVAVCGRVRAVRLV